MDVVYKFRLGSIGGGPNLINMPKSAKILSVGEQFGVVNLWAIVDSDDDLSASPIRAFYSIPTGRPYEALRDLNYVGTVMLGGGRAVYHIFMDDDD